MSPLAGLRSCGEKSLSMTTRAAKRALGAGTVNVFVSGAQVDTPDDLARARRLMGG